MKPFRNKKSAQKEQRKSNPNKPPLSNSGVNISCKEAMAFGAAIVAGGSLTIGFGAGQRYAEYQANQNQQYIYPEERTVCDTRSGITRDTRSPKATEIDRPYLCSLIDVCERKTPDDTTYGKMGRIIVAQYDPQQHSLDLSRCRKRQAANPSPTL